VNERPTLLNAAWIAPMDVAPIRDGAVVFSQDRIIAVGALRDLTAVHPDAERIDLGESIVLPGLVNAHVHLELSDLDQQHLRRGGFVTWILELIRRRGAGPIQDAVARGIAQCRRFGVTSVGDITRECAISRQMLSCSRLRGVSYGELQAMARRRELLDTRLSAAMDDLHASPSLKIGVSPHAPYTVEPDAYRACLTTGLPLATHLAETPDEAQFLAEHTGQFRHLWESLGWWDDRVPKFAGGPIRLAQSLGLLDRPTLLAHVNYCDDDELAILSAGQASVVYCPRTHAYFGHRNHRWREMLAAGINVAVGTDSCASSPDLNLVDDLRLLHRIAPDVPALQLWQMATTRAAKAIQMEKMIGSLTRGMTADFVVFDVRTDDPLREILETDVLPRVWSSLPLRER
jgi:cytosine/adenosine deaminase-related metal-dependent hydrolase